MLSSSALKLDSSPSLARSYQVGYHLALNSISLSAFSLLLPQFTPSLCLHCLDHRGNFLTSVSITVHFTLLLQHSSMNQLSSSHILLENMQFLLTTNRTKLRPKTFHDTVSALFLILLLWHLFTKPSLWLTGSLNMFMPPRFPPHLSCCFLHEATVALARWCIFFFWSALLEIIQSVPSMWTFKLQIFKRCEHASGSRKEPKPVPSTSGMSEIAPLLLRLLLLMILQLYHLPPPLPPPVSNSSCLFTEPASVGQLLYCATILFKVLYCKI